MKSWKVFPLDGKRPALSGDWRSHATDSPAQIREWIACSWGLGLACDLSGVIVLDPDAAKDDPFRKLGMEELVDTFGTDFLATITRQGDWIDTPGGGRHYFFDDNGTPVAGRDLTPHTNVRSRGGYVRLYDPGMISRLCQGYNPPLSTSFCLPEVVRERLAEKATNRMKAVVTPAIEDALRRTRLMLTEVKPAVEGFGGDNHTYRTINKVLDIMPTADPAIVIEAMGDWNQRCDPPWDVEELMIKIENAAEYRQNDVGAWGVAPLDTRFPGSDAGDGDGPGYVERAIAFERQRNLGKSAVLAYGYGKAADPVASSAGRAEAPKLADRGRFSAQWDLRDVGTGALIQELRRRLPGIRALQFA